MKTILLFCCFLLSVVHWGIAQSSFVDSLLAAIQYLPDDSNKAFALKILSRELWNEEREYASVFYSNTALALEEKLKIQEQVAEIAPELVSAKGNPAAETVKSLQALDARLERIERRQDTLNFALKEYENRSSSFADDMVITAKFSKERITSQQRLTLQYLQNERTKRNWIIAVSIISLVLLSLVFTQIYRRRKALNTLEVQRLNNKVLRSQLNPHFIFNALDSVKRYIKQYPALAESYLTKFSTLMRQVLENSREEKISLQEEIAMLENYMQLEALRLPQGFDYEISLDPSADAANTMIPPMILQPVVENAIWHGLNPLKHRGKILFQFSEVNDLLQVSIIDNGVGLDSASVSKVDTEKKISLGLKITRERIELLNRKAKSKGSLMQQLFETGSTVRVVIPL